MVMEDWQGCLSPACQTALQSALTRVTGRGGYAVTLEDFFLAMLDDIPELRRFLQRQGVELDELTRTVQCEQPIVTEVASENLLSSQLVYWLHTAREVSGAVWLQWPELLKALVHSADRLQEKAYVAVLEAVAHWPSTGSEVSNEQSDKAAVPPLVMADSQWLGLVEDISLLLSTSADAIVWIHGERGSGKSSWLKSLIATLPGGAIEMDIRREADIMASDERAMTVPGEPASIPPVLVFDNVSPPDLVSIMASEFSVARELVTSFPGPVLMLGPDSEDASHGIRSLEKTLGRELDCRAMPASSASQKQAILTARQPIIEKRWGIELASGVVEYVAACTSPLAASPGAMLQWVEHAAARLSLFADRGPMEAAVLAGKADSVRRQLLLALARQQPIEHFERSIESLESEQAASEASWHERKRSGRLRLLTVDDLGSELERRVAAAEGSGHYIANQNQTGELEFARS